MPKQKYKHKLEHYTDIYGCKFRTIQRYSALGYPLDDEEQTRARIAAQKFQPTSTPATVSEIGTGSDAPRGAKNDPRTDRTPKPGAHGLAAAIDRLQAAEEAAHAEYLTAGNEVLAAAKLKAWLSLSEQLRKVEQSTPDIEKQNNNSVSLTELAKVLGGLFARLRQDLDTLPRQVASKLVAKDQITIEQELKGELERIIEALYACVYLKGGQDE